MANKRMFAKSVVESTEFVTMPHSAQCLYLHLSMNADDDGVVNNAELIMRMGAFKTKDYKKLIENGFVLEISSKICVITHWRVNNTIRSERYTPTLYQKEIENLCITNKKYCLDVTHNGTHNVTHNVTPVQNSIEKNRQEQVFVCISESDKKGIWEIFCDKLATFYPEEKIDKDSAYQDWKLCVENLSIFDDFSDNSNVIGVAIWHYIQEYRKTHENANGSANPAYVCKLSSLFSGDKYDRYIKPNLEQATKWVKSSKDREVTNG